MYMDYHKKLSEIDEEKIQEDYEDWKEAKQYLTELENKIKLNESKTKSLNHHNSDLMKFTYDENCEFCIKMVKNKYTNKKRLKIKQINYIQNILINKVAIKNIMDQKSQY